jgi:hypothetical protein
VVAGVASRTTAAAGESADLQLASVNVGQVLVIDIPAAVAATSAERFVGATVVEFGVWDSLGRWTEQRVNRSPLVAPGGTSLAVQVPPAATATQWVRVPGFGSLPLRVVPTLTRLTRLTGSSFPACILEGEGFTDTTLVQLSTGQLIPFRVESPSRIFLSQTPPMGERIQVSTGGGSSELLTVA